MIDRGRDWMELSGARVEGVAELLPAEHPDLRAPMSAWHDKYRSMLAGEGFERFAVAVPTLGFLRVVPARRRHVGPPAARARLGPRVISARVRGTLKLVKVFTSARVAGAVAGGRKVQGSFDNGRARRRRRPGRVGGRLPPRPTRHRRHAVEKAAFPREKVCGDGLTPRSVKAIQDMGVDTDDPRFERVIGLRVHARRTTIQLPVARPHDVPAVRARDAARRVRSPPRRARGEGGRPAARADGGRRARIPATATWSERVCDPRGERDAEPTEISRTVRARRRRRREPLREAGRRPPRPESAARDRRPPLLPRRLPPGSVDRVLARPVGRRPAVARLRLAVPRCRRPDQPRRGAAQHLRGIPGHLGAAAVRRLRTDAAAGVEHRRGDG